MQKVAGGVEGLQSVRQCAELDRDLDWLADGEIGEVRFGELDREPGPHPKIDGVNDGRLELSPKPTK